MGQHYDALFSVWRLAWFAHQLPRDPAHLFDANIFYPERLTLAYSEAMIVQGVLAIPIVAAGGSAVLAYNLVMLAGFASGLCKPAYFLIALLVFAMPFRWRQRMAIVAATAAGTTGRPRYG